MSFTNCLHNNFNCKKNLDEKQKKINDVTISLKQERSNLKRSLTSKIKQYEKLNIELWKSEHYRFMYKDLPAPHTIKSDMSMNPRLKLKEQFGESATQFETDVTDKFTYNTSGVSNWRIPLSVFKKLLHKYPVKMYDVRKGYTDNSVIRFFSEINISLYWNIVIFAVKTKTRWVIAFWPSDGDDFVFADPKTKKIWFPDPSKDEDNIEFLLS